MWQYITQAIKSVYNFFAHKNSREPSVESPDSPIINESADERKEIIEITKNPNTWSLKRIFYRSLTISALLLDTMFVVFLYKAMQSAIEYTLTEFNEKRPEIETPLLIISGVLISMNLISELLVINPIEEAEHMTNARISALAEGIEGSYKCEQITIRSFSILNQILAQPTYAIGAASDALSLAYLTSITWLRWSYGIPITFLGMVYYNILTRTKINQHAQEFVHNLLNCHESILISTLRTPLKSLEVIIQSSSNAIYRAVTFGYIMEQVLVELFNQDDHNTSNLYFISAAVFLTFYISLFSRTLNVRDKILNKQFATIPANIIEQTHISKIGLCFDVIMTMLRAGPASIIIYRHGLQNQIANIILSSSVGCALALQGLYVRYKTRLYQTALDNMEKPMPHIQRHTENLFDAIKEQNKTKDVRGIASILNSCSRISRSVAFLGFLAVLNDELADLGVNLKLDFWDLLCIHQLWGNTTFENELSFFQSMLEENLAYYKTKLQIERKSPYFGMWGCFWKTKKDYSQERLEEFLPLPMSKFGAS